MTELDSRSRPPKEIGVQREGKLPLAPGETAEATRYFRVTKESMQVRGLWLGRVRKPVGAASGAHHHGEAKTSGFMVQSRGFIRSGGRYSEVMNFAEGDFPYLPPLVHHLKGSASKDTESIWLRTRIRDEHRGYPRERGHRRDRDRATLLLATRAPHVVGGATAWN